MNSRNKTAIENINKALEYLYVARAALRLHCLFMTEADKRAERTLSLLIDHALNLDDRLVLESDLAAA